MLHTDLSLTSDTPADRVDRLLEQLRSPHTGGALAEKMAIEFIECGHDQQVGTVPVSGNTQPMGLFHGGVHVVLAESLASMHSYLLAGGKSVVGVDLNATHLRAAREGVVTGRAEVLHQGRTI